MYTHAMEIEVEAANLFYAVEAGETGMGQWKPTTMGR